MYASGKMTVPEALAVIVQQASEMLLEKVNVDGKVHIELDNDGRLEVERCDSEEGG